MLSTPLALLLLLSAAPPELLVSEALAGGPAGGGIAASIGCEVGCGPLAAPPSGLLCASRPGVVALPLAGVASLAAAGGVGPEPTPLTFAATAPDGVALEEGTAAAVRTGVLAAALEFFRARALPFLSFSADPILGVLVTLVDAGEPPCVAPVLLAPVCCCKVVAVMRGEGEEIDAAPGGPMPPVLEPSCEDARCIPGRCMLAGDEPICIDEK